MNATPPDELSTTQRTMLDLALACDLNVSDPAHHTALRTRHRAIHGQQEAANYIREVENKIHSRRKFTVPPGVTAPSGAARVATAPAKPYMKPATLSSTQTGFAIFFIIVAMVAAGLYAPPGLNLAAVTFTLLLMMAVLGWGTTGRALGILVNERNLMSLARFQTVVWTVIVLGAYLTYALARIRTMAEPDALAIQLDWHLWALLGFSTTSLIGAPLILNTRKNQDPAPAVAEKTARALNEPAADINANRQGTLYANGKPTDARITDMFEGDELANTGHLDLAKVQMFYFTLIAALCFFVMVFQALVTSRPENHPYLDHLPVLPDGLIAILGISHAGYLGGKTVSRTQSQPQS